VQRGNGKLVLMGRRTSGNKNNNKAAVYGKRREGKSNGAKLLEAEGVMFQTASEAVVTFLALASHGHCAGMASPCFPVSWESLWLLRRRFFSPP